MESQMNRWDGAVLGTVKGRSSRRLWRNPCTNAGELGWRQVLLVGSERILSEVHKRKAKVPCVQTRALRSVQIQGSRDLGAGGWTHLLRHEFHLKVRFTFFFKSPK